MKIARQLGRNSVGIEIKKTLVRIVKKKTGFGNGCKTSDTFELILRNRGKYGYIS